jgi:hypothetical protein
VSAAPASAEVTRSFEASFTGADAPEGPFAIVRSVAADDSGGPSSGDVYAGGLSSTFASVVDKFDASGSYAGVQITGAETPQDSFSMGIGGIAVDSSSSANKGDIYVADVEHNVIDRFGKKGGEEGKFLCQITAKKPVSAEEIAHECNGAAGSEVTGTPSIVPGGLAVDSSGDLYVADSEHDVIDEFKPSGEYAGQIASPEITIPTSIALDSSGNLYVTNYGSNVVKFNAAGHFVSVLDSGGKPSSVAVDPTTGHVDVYELDGGQIAEYEPATGAPLGRFGASHFRSNAAAYIAVGPTGKVYAGEDEGPGAVVNIFGPDIVVPTVSVEAVSGVEEGAATFNGEVSPDTAHGGTEVSACKFEYVTAAQFEAHPSNRYESAAEAPCASALPYTAATKVSAGVTGLAASTTYHVRLAAVNANAPGHTSYSEEPAEEVFTTKGPPAIDSESATELTISTMRLEARIDPFGYDTTCEVQYVDEAEFQSSGYANAATLPCVPADLGSGFADQSASATLSGLTPDTTYHYRFIATNQAGTVPGADQTLATFGLESFSFGGSSTQAGAHPDMTDSFALNTSTNLFGAPFGLHATDANPREVQTELPPGLIGNPDATPKCSPYHVERHECSAAAQVGVITVYTPRHDYEEPLYNVVPPAGVAAQFGAEVSTFGPAYIDASIRSGSDYGVTADSSGISADEGILAVSVTLWGVPADPSHTPERRCAGSPFDGCASETEPKPLLTNPTSCSGPLKTTMRVDSWQAPTSFAQAVSEMAGMTGCERLHFTPTIEVTPESTSSDSPTGLSVDLHVPQNEDPAGLAEADLRDALVTLPEGVTVNPSGAYGRQGCSPAQIELHGPEPAQCPDASKIGSVQIETPLLEHPLQGGVYLAQQGNAGPAQGTNPFGSLLAIYIAVDEPQSGVVVKLAGEVVVNPQTGRLTTTFDENPQLPFEELKLDFFGGSRAPLSTPAACGVYTTTTSLTPWSAPESGPAATPFSTFPISSGPGGSACAAQGFAPSFIAGTSHNQAGAFSPFTLRLSRQDGEQTLSTVSTQMPPGLLGMLSKVQLCGEPQAKEGRCPAASQVGHVTATAGVGNEPLALPEAGKPQDPVFLTGPYDGAPFGLSIVVPAEAGPFNLGTVVVRAAIHIDPATTQISVVSDPIPTRLEGIPLDVRTVNVTVDRPGFMFNPTDCEPLSVTGAIGSSEGASENVSSRFQAANCATLPFAPKLTASVAGHASKADGASFDVKIESAGLGQANIHKVDLTLPKALPSRLSTLQKACLAAVFESNPASCSPESIIGKATIHTPLLTGPLSGPAYLVSHGGAAFPDVEFVLQSEGVQLILDGKTQIKNGITYSKFETAPDAPFTSFETELPAGPKSIFGVYQKSGSYNLCATTLQMPTEITGQNGAVITQTTAIAATGCPPSVSITKTAIKANSVTVTLKLGQAGTVKITGKGLKTTTRKGLKAGTHTITVPLTATGRAAKKHRTKLKVQAALSASGKTGTATSTLTA